jgi:hypothetical protein
MDVFHVPNAKAFFPNANIETAKDIVPFHSK